MTLALPLLAGIEAGGTKFVCGVGQAPGEILRSHTVPTREPAATLPEVRRFFAEASAEFGPIASAGIASFGPLDLDPASSGYGSVIDTPKRGWSDFNLRRAVSEGLRCRVAIDTDVAGSGLAEAAMGAGRGRSAIAYVTIGTGVGGALIVDGKPLHKVLHPEMGHIPLRRHPLDAGFAGVCPFHGDCLEGLANGPSVVARTGQRLSDLPAASPVWAILADYLAQLCLSIRLIGTPQRIIMGGGVMSNTALYPLIHAEILRQNNGYLRGLATLEAVRDYVVPPALGDKAGLIGALLMAREVNPGP